MRIPLDDVHLFVVQLADDVLHALPAQADAGADRIHLFVARPDRQLGAEAGLTGDPFDFNCAIADFGDFQLEKLHDELRVGARENDLRSVRALFDRLDVTADAFADLVFLGRHALAVGEQRLEFAEVNRDVRPFETADGAADNVAGSVLELGVNELLHERLLGVLRGDAPEVGRSHLHFDFIAKLGVGFEAPGVKERNLVMLGSDLVGDDQLGERSDVAGFWVDGAAQFTGRTDGLFGRGQQRLFHGLHQDVFVDALLAFPIFQYR